ncbi:MAG TPA: YetF domain-containing protein [Candidatus Udaeobacter sp.]|nr:YetF domain-containing protein [Candidatus Udaeobacter sp.]
MNALWNSFETLLGLGVEPKDLTFIQISLRGIIVFLVTLATMRLGHKRSLSRKTPFDAVLLVILAAVLSRAINGSAAFFATLGGGVVLVLLHRLFAYLAFYSHYFGILVKGKPDTIVRDGKHDFYTMRRNHVSMHDLDEDMRLSAHTDDLSKIRVARVERSGDISFIEK